MSHSPFLYCACWDPWNVRGKKLIKTMPGLPNQKARDPFNGFRVPDTRFPELNIFSFGPQASGEFIEISPGYTLTRSKEHLSVTLGEEFFEKKNATEEPMVSHFREDVITDLEEQIAELTDMMEQLRRDHQASLCSVDLCIDVLVRWSHRELQEAHCAELQALQVQYKKELRTERASAQEKMGMDSLIPVVFMDSVSDEMEEKWLRRQAEWKKSERTEREKALLQQKQELMKKFELEREQLKKSSQSGNSMMNKHSQQEREVASPEGSIKLHVEVLQFP
uniref:Flagellum associated containing coiled-coil domains 1 n=1 Tax=Chrysemys picta bellii TaxID=8478 RepID=A0A8C3HC92_CHRPI